MNQKNGKKMNIRRARRIQALFFVVLLSLYCACETGRGNGETGRASLTDVAMGTVCTFTVYPGENGEIADAEKVVQETFVKTKALEEDLLSRRLETAQTWRINHAGGEGIAVSNEMVGLLERCREMTESSEGAFDVSIGAICELWGMDEIAAGEKEPSIPAQEEISAALGCCGMERVRLKDGQLILEDGALLDFGSVGKGLALDLIAEYLRETENGGEGKLQGGVFSLGGSILTYGEKPDGTKWKVAVKDPRNPGETIGMLEFSGNWCISTSGDYERFFELDGRRYQHIMDPKTGYPAESDVRSVTILSESGFLSDALSTACLVLGREKGMALAARFHAECLMVGQNGEIWLSDGMKPLFFGAN